MLRFLRLPLRVSACAQCAFATVISNKIIFTPSCVRKLKEIGEDHGLLRVIVDSGGCSGFQYKYELDKKINEDDLIIENSGVRIVVDSQSMQFIEGSKLDFEDELIRSGFQIQNNPQSEKALYKFVCNKMSEVEDTVSNQNEADSMLLTAAGRIVSTVLEDSLIDVVKEPSSLPDRTCRPTDWAHNRPALYATVENEFSHGPRNEPVFNNYLRGCKWSPDGTCLLTQSYDNAFRIFDFDLIEDEKQSLTKELIPRLRIEENYPVLDYCWYPFMNTDDDRTCAFISARKRSTIRMWDSKTGILRCTYMPTNLNGEPENVKSIAFSSDGSCIFCGFKRFIMVINTEYPAIMRRIPKFGEKPQLKGIISAIATPPYNECGSSGLYALGTFNGTVDVYSQGSGSASVIECASGPSRGVSQLKFLSERYLIAGGRVDGVIQMWDLNGTSKEPCLTFHRRVENYQRFQFDVDPTDRYLFTGNQTGAVSCYNLSTGDLEFSWLAHKDSCNGIAIHPSRSLLATAAGQRRPLGMFEGSDEDDLPRTLTDEEAVKILSNGDGELPLRGQLHLLPIRKEVRIWKFPLVD